LSGLLTILPLAFVMIAGPQIISAVFLATTDKWPQNCGAYVAGAALSITLTATLAFFLADNVKGSGSDSGSGGDAINIAVLVLLLFLVVYVFLGRKKAEPPKWMGKLQSASPKFAFTLGFLLLGVFPTDIITSITVGGKVAGEGEPWWHILPFVALTLLFLALPAILVLLLGERAKAFLPKARDWMNTHSWIISEIVIVFFIGITINSLAS
jgi:hypothetical protein